jgi:tetratricopeptide (TPR) repeat protein
MAGAAVVLVVLLAGIVASVLEANRARRAEQIAVAVNDFLQNDLLAKAGASAQAHPDTNPDPDLKVRTALDRAAARVGGRFATQPQVEATIRQTIGSAYRDLGLLPQAQQQMMRALELRRKTLGDSHHDTLTTSAKLAELYLDQGEYSRGVPLISRALEIDRRVLGEQHNDTLEAMGLLASMYDNTGNYAQAEPLFIKVLEIRRRVLGEQHHDTRPRSCFAMHSTCTNRRIQAPGSDMTARACSAPVSPLKHGTKRRSH